ncbi:putative dihydrodipicolinate reductase [Rosa chinensis]|uniref:Putative dihydrodipicolinate reductase n=1 Tax=Rosa chinensis TaxID=74649 RepID=A0A2P6SMX0_ROSCH|nr:putative dihydrodipicolinate reductase [Rosa chinensis]
MHVIWIWTLFGFGFGFGLELESIVHGCLVTPTLSIGSILLQQAAVSASFHYNNVEIVESRAQATVYILKHDITDVQSLMPGLLILAIRKIIRIKV